MRFDVDVVVSPDGQLATGVISRVEDLLIQQLVSQAAVERLNECILLWLAGIELMPINVVIAGPLSLTMQTGFP